MIADHYSYNCGEDVRAAPEPVSCRGLGAEHRFVRLTVIFPACWNGMSLDSPDHRAHMAYPTAAGCPDTHRVVLPRLGIIAKFPVRDARGYRLTSGDPGTAHADFWNTWRQGKLRRLVDKCLGTKAEQLCGSLGD